MDVDLDGNGQRVEHRNESDDNYWFLPLPPAGLLVPTLYDHP